MNALVVFENLQWVQIASGMRCKTFSSDKKTIRLIELTEGFADSDWCEKSHTNYILEGEFSLDFFDEQTRIKKGDTVYIPEGHKHKAILGKDERVLMLDF